MTHLEDYAAALVDGELAPDARDRALSHIAGCAACRAEVEAQRRVKALLANQADAEPPADLAARLQALARQAPVPIASAPRAARTRRPVPARGLFDSRRTIAAAAAGIAAAAAMVVLGGNGEPGVTPPVDRFMVDHAATTGQLPLNDPAAGIVVSTVHSR